MAEGNQAGAGPLRLAVAGMGLRGVSMTGLVLSSGLDVEVVALVDRILARAELARDRHGLRSPCFDNLRRCLDEAKPDALAVFTPDVFHEDSVIPALQHGVHVYCEKPMATTLAACDRMIAAAGGSKALFYMGHNMRMGALYHTIHQVVAAGDLGELLTLATNEYYHGGRTYFRRWNRLLAVGGGLWVTKTVHDFDMMCWLIGDEPASICAVGGRRVFQPKAGAGPRCRDCPLRWECDDHTPPRDLPVGNPDSEADVRFWRRWQELGASDGYLPHDACLYRGDIETLEYGAAVVRFAGGACATHTLSVVTSRQLSGRWLMAHGTKGCLRADPLTDTVHVSFRGDQAARTYDVREQSRGSHGGSDGRIFADFVRCCRTGGRPVATAADGRRAVRLGLAAQRSMEEGAVVDLTGD